MGCFSLLQFTSAHLERTADALRKVPMVEVTRGDPECRAGHRKGRFHSPDGRAEHPRPDQLWRLSLSALAGCHPAPFTAEPRATG